jgi:pyruvate/2-oxoglutarate dehydrogenase complex dihydrolipoamide dehydrogenase (E3) component
MANRLIQTQKDLGIATYEHTQIQTIQKLEQPDSEGSLYQVEWVSNGQTHKDNFKTLLLAIGRTPNTQTLGLDNIDLQLSSDGKVFF